MAEGEEVKEPERRSGLEMKRLVAEFETSELRQNELLSDARTGP
jgi:hypothetical protein